MQSKRLLSDDVHVCLKPLPIRLRDEVLNERFLVEEIII